MHGAHNQDSSPFSSTFDIIDGGAIPLTLAQHAYPTRCSPDHISSFHSVAFVQSLSRAKDPKVVHFSGCRLSPSTSPCAKAIYWGYLALRADKLALPFDSPEDVCMWRVATRVCGWLAGRLVHLWSHVKASNQHSKATENIMESSMGPNPKNSRRGADARTAQERRRRRRRRRREQERVAPCPRGLRLGGNKP